MDIHETASNSDATQSESVRKPIQMENNQTNQSCHDVDQRTSPLVLASAQTSAQVGPVSVESKIMAHAHFKIKELQKKVEELEQIITEMKTSLSDRDQTILQQGTKIELLEAANDANSLRTTAEKRVSLAKKVAPPVIEKTTIQQNAIDGLTEKRKRGRPKADSAIKPVRGTYIDEPAQLDESDDGSILVDFDLDIYGANKAEQTKHINSAEQSLSIILEHYKANLKSVEQAKSVRFKSFEKGTLILFILFSLVHDVFLTIEDTRRSDHARTDSLRVVKTFQCSHCGMNLASLIFDSRIDKYIHLRMISLDHKCKLEDLIEYFATIKRKSAVPNQKHRVLTQARESIKRVANELNGDIKLIKLFIDLTKFRTFYHRASLELLLQLIVVQENQFLTSQKLTRSQSVEYIIEKVNNIFCYKLQLLNKNSIAQINQLLRSHHTSETAVERIKKSIRHSLSFQAIWPYSSDEAFSQQSLLASLPVLQLYHNDLVLFHEDGSLISTNTDLEPKLLTLFESNNSNSKSGQRYNDTSHEAEDESNVDALSPDTELFLDNLNKDKGEDLADAELFTIGQFSHCVESFFVTSSRLQPDIYKTAMPFNFDVNQIDPKLLATLHKALVEGKQVKSLYFSQKLPRDFLSQKGLPVIGFDGTFLKVRQSKQQQFFKTMLIATIKLGSNTTVPLGFFLCDHESYATWFKFMSTFELLNHEFLLSLNDFTITADAEKGLAAAIRTVFVEHRYSFLPCVFHLGKNVLKYTKSVSKQDEGERVSLLTVLTQTSSVSRANTARINLLDRFASAHRSNRNHTYVTIDKHSGLFNRSQRGTPTWEVFTSNQCEQLNSLFKEIRELNTVSLIISSLLYQQVKFRDSQRVFVPHLNNKSPSQIQLTDFGSAIYSMILAISQLYTVNSIAAGESHKGKWTISIGNEMKTKVSRGEFFALIKRYNTAMKRKPSYVEYRKLFFEELYESEALVTESFDSSSLLCSMCKSDSKSFTYCAHITAVIINKSNIQLAVNYNKLLGDRKLLRFAPLNCPELYIHSSLIRDWKGTQGFEVVEFPENSAKTRQYIEEVRKVICREKMSADEKASRHKTYLKRHRDARDKIRSNKKKKNGET